MSHPPPPPPPPPYGYGWVPAPYPGPWAPPPRKKWNRTTVALVTGGALLAAAILTVVVLAGISLGRSEASAGGALSGGGLSGGGLGGAASVETSPPADPTGLGDDAGLDGYAQRCHDGLMQACDDLYGLSEQYSDYEYYGLTCGGRVKPLDVPTCTVLDED